MSRYNAATSRGDPNLIIAMPIDFIRRLKLQLSPPKLHDPDFGDLIFIYIPNAPERSYWEGEWLFPPTGTHVGIDLLGPESGPLPQARTFYLNIPNRFEVLFDLARPALDQVFRDWYDRPLSADLWQDVKLAGFGLDDPNSRPLEWEMSFEATEKKWLGITIPFRDKTPGPAIVDT